MNSKGGSSRGEHRSSALWGTGNRGGDSRSNALWGKGGRGLVTALVAVLVVAAPLAAGAHKSKNTTGASLAPTYIDPILLAKANTTPNEIVNVIIQSDRGVSTAKDAYADAEQSEKEKTKDRERMGRKFEFVGSVSAELKARKVLFLARVPGLSVTYDARVKLSGYTSRQLWTTASGVKPLWDALPATGQKMPAIAIVDSGIEKNRADFDMGARVTDDVVITQLKPNSQGDGRGHGTFVAGIAAGSATDQAGAAPQAGH